MERTGLIEVVTAPDRTTVHLVGQIGSHLRWDASLAMAEALRCSRPVVVDASAATTIDAAGMAFLIQCINACEQADLPISVTGAHGYLAELLDTFGLERVIAAE